MVYIIVQGFDMIILHCGANNLYLCTPTEFGGYVEQVLHAIFLRNPDTKVILSAVLPRLCDFTARDSLVGGFNVQLHRLADMRMPPRFAVTTVRPGFNTYFVSMSRIFRRNGSFLQYRYAIDGLHPSRDGNRKLTDKLRCICNAAEQYHYNQFQGHLNRLDFWEVICDHFRSINWEQQQTENPYLE